MSLGKAVIVGDSGPDLTELDADFPVIMVADGMGGHAHRALASQSALEAILKAIQPPLDHTIGSAVLAANELLYEMMRDRPELAGLGTTVVGVAFSEAGIVHFNVGDSRAYLHRPGKLSLLSHDDVPGGQPVPRERDRRTRSPNHLAVDAFEPALALMWDGSLRSASTKAFCSAAMV